MNKGLFLMILAFLPPLLLSVGGQEKKKEDIERFKAAKRTFLIKEIGLSEKEAADFFPLYEKMQDEKFQLNRSVRRQFKAIVRSQEKVSDEEYLRIVEEMGELPVKEAEIEKKFAGQFQKILSPEKLFKYKLAEIRFTRELLKDHRKDKSVAGDKKDIH